MRLGPGAVIVLAWATVSLTNAPAVEVRGSPPTLAILDITVIDVAGAVARPHRSVLIENGRISRVIGATSFRPPDGVQVIDGAGLYLIPGLWDMHTHSGGYGNAITAYPQLAAHGILGVRDMGTPLEDMVRIRDALHDGRLVGPRLVFAGPLLQGPLPFTNPLLWQIARASDARQVVDSLRRRGVSFIKVGDAVPGDIWDSVRVAAREARLPLVGHVPPSISVWHATRMGQASIEHLGGRYFGVLLGCSTAEDRMRRSIGTVIDSLITAIRAGREGDDSRLNRAAFTRELLKTLNAERTNELLKAFRAHHTWQVPTLGALPIRGVMADSARFNAEDRRLAAALIARSMLLVRQMQRAGVGVMAGTDLSLAPGDLPHELELLVEAGLSPMQALQAATVNPARFLGASDSLGTVAPGKVADLVLLQADPLADIRNVTRVQMVIRAGAPLSRTP
jgi:imidazolonepropionase-like amidohydrolase